MLNKFKMPLIICIESFSYEIKYNNYRRVQNFLEGVTYSWTKSLDYSNNTKVDMAYVYEESGNKGLCSVPLDMFNKHFVSLDDSILEINNVFEKIMDI